MDESGGFFLTLMMALISDPSDPEHSVSKSALEAAEYYLRIEKPEHALKIVSTLLDTNDRLDFYKNKGFVDESIKLLLETKGIKALYCALKGSNRFEKGASIALKYNDIENHIVFFLLDIKAKLWSHDTSYTETEKLQDIEKLHLLDKQTCRYHTKEQINYCIAMLKNKLEYYHHVLDISYGFMKLITFDTILNAFKSQVQVIPIIKNLGFLLKIHKMHQKALQNVDIRMLKFYHILVYCNSHNGENESIFPPMILLKLPVKWYKTDTDGNVVMPLKKLKVMLNRHTRSIAKSWLKVLDELLGKYDQSNGVFNRCIRAKHVIGTLRYCCNLISCKYYYEQFEINYAEDIDNNVAETMLMNVLSLPWICYIPSSHRTAEVFLHAPVIAKLFRNLKIYDIEEFASNWIFQGNTATFYDFKKFAKETVDRYSASIPTVTPNGSFVSKFEIITIGLLAIFSVMNKHYCLIIPQSYEMVIEWFNETNNNRFFPLLRKTSITCEDVIDLLLNIIKILLTDDPFTSVLTRVYIMEYPDNYPLQYLFERWFVLALTLFGNLAPLLEDDIKNLFDSSLQTIEKLSVIMTAKNTSHPKKFRAFIREAANAISTGELLIVIYKIQKLYSRNMVKFNLKSRNKPFEVVEPADFPSFLLFSDCTEEFEEEEITKLDCTKLVPDKD